MTQAGAALAERTSAPVASLDHPEVRALLDLFAVARTVADPLVCVPPHLPRPGKGRTIVVGAGKAAAAMARAVETSWPGPLEGLVVTRHGHGMHCDRIEVIEAAHPVPDAAGVEAGRRILAMVSGLGRDDLVLCLISGGGSALLDVAPEGVPFEDIRVVNRALLMSGAPISEMNCVRKHLSQIKGGRLAAAAYPARVVTIAISDVPRDDPSTIASGPTVADPTTREDAQAVLKKYGIKPSAAIASYLRDPRSETPKPGHPAFQTTDFRLAARPTDMVAAVAAAAAARGYAVLNLGAEIEGEAREIGVGQAALARAHAVMMEPGRRPLVIISGGETSVSVGSGGGRGGRNSEYLLALTIGLDGLPGAFALAADTDGIDGSEDNAGAVITPSTLERASKTGIDARDALAGHDSYGLFRTLGDLLVTGPTRTNVNDLRLILVQGAVAR